MKNPFVETITNVVSAVKWYLVLLGLLLWGYTCAFYMLFRRDDVLVLPPPLHHLG
jgi:hypothetical protein